MPVAQLLSATGPVPQPTPVVQAMATVARAESDAAPTDPGSAAPATSIDPVGQPAAASPGGTPAVTVQAGAAPAGGAAAAQMEPEELLKKLFDPLLRRLKAELRLDRERRGSFTDLRR